MTNSPTTATDVYTAMIAAEMTHPDSPEVAQLAVLVSALLRETAPIA